MIDTHPDPGTPPEEPPAGDAEQPAPSRSWRQLGEDDKRMLYITIVGGLAANVGLVIIVGLGIALLRLISHSHLWREIFESVTVIVATACATLLLMVTRPASKQMRRFNLTALTVYGATLTGLLLLVLVGYAAGVK